MRKLSRLLTTIFSCVALQAIAQADLSYYLPDNVAYDTTIPTPKRILGHEVGELHVTHDKLVQYMKILDEISDRITLETIGHTHEARPLVLLTITSPENQKNIESIRRQHVQLTDPAKSSSLNIRTMPAVFYLGCSIHGNEPSGSNAALLTAYHLAAARGKDIEDILKNVVILLDPSLNPDGMQRFSTWVNSRKSKSNNEDVNDMEHNEPWPTSRTNHYWFDLNRDWIVAMQPESKARVAKFHQWKPNLLTDHHEMQTNQTFFFQPGVPSRKHPLTPQKNHDLTGKIGTYHAKALDAIGSLYFTQEAFDDFYHGKGSSFPDIQGSVGILFEQASARGHAHESPNGVLTFPFAIRNQFTTALSSLKAASELHEELLQYQRQFFNDALADASKDPIKAIVFGSKDRGATKMLADLFLRHEIELFSVKGNIDVNGKSFTSENALILPLHQRQYRLIKSMTEKRTTFQDSIFYDISAWNVLLASGVAFEELKSTPALGEKVEFFDLRTGTLPEKSAYAYCFEPNNYYAPKAINTLLQNNILCKVATEEFSQNGKKFLRGSIVIPAADQTKSPDVIAYLLKEIALDGIDIHSFTTGLDYNGKSLGSGSFLSLKEPELAMLVDGNVSATDAGEIWHLLDTRFNIPVTLIPTNTFNSANINRYNTIILPPGTYSSITEPAREKLKQWVQHGGVLIGLESALSWLHASGFGKFDAKKIGEEDSDRPMTKSYADIENYKGAQETSGAIFNAIADLSHPLLFGFEDRLLPVFKRNNVSLERSKNSFANPMVFSSTPLISGYISKSNLEKSKDSSIVGVSVLGKGRVIGFSENLTFRGFWFGTSRMLTNAIFYGHLINEASAR